MSLLAATIAYLVADLVYGFVRMDERFPTYGQRGRLIEASLVAAVVMAGGWLVAPAVLDPFWTGLGGLAVYGPLSIPIFAAFWFLGRPLLPSIGVSGLLFIITVFLLGGVNVFLLNMPVSDFSDALNIPFVVGNALAIFAGTYIVITVTDKGRNNQEKERERERIPSGPTTYSPTRNTNANANGDRSPSSHNANDAVVAEDVSIDGPPGTHSSTGSSPSKAKLRNLTYDWQHSPQRFTDIGGYDD